RVALPIVDCNPSVADCGNRRRHPGDRASPAHPALDLPAGTAFGPSLLRPGPERMRVGGPVEEEVLVSTTTAPLRVPTLLGRRERPAERRRLKRLDALSSHLAELFSIRPLLVQAADIVGEGWVQGAWFTVSTPEGGRAITGFDLRLARTPPAPRALLVG